MNAAKFIRWCIEQGPFNGCDLDGGDVQAKAVRCGILKKVKYDEAKHGPSEVAHQGCDWYEFTDNFQKL